jgi:hypothetical protein
MPSTSSWKTTKGASFSPLHLLPLPPLPLPPRPRPCPHPCRPSQLLLHLYPCPYLGCRSDARATVDVVGARLRVLEKPAGKMSSLRILRQDLLAPARSAAMWHDVVQCEPSSVDRGLPRVWGLPFSRGSISPTWSHHPPLSWP